MKKLNEFEIKILEHRIKEKISEYAIPYSVTEDKITFDIVPLNITIIMNLSCMANDQKPDNITDCIDYIIKLIEEKSEINEHIRHYYQCNRILPHSKYLFWELLQKTMP